MNTLRNMSVQDIINELRPNFSVRKLISEARNASRPINISNSEFIMYELCDFHFGLESKRSLFNFNAEQEEHFNRRFSHTEKHNLRLELIKHATTNKLSWFQGYKADELRRRTSLSCLKIDEFNEFTLQALISNTNKTKLTQVKSLNLIDQLPFIYFNNNKNFDIISKFLKVIWENTDGTKFKLSASIIEYCRYYKSLLPFKFINQKTLSDDLIQIPRLATSIFTVVDSQNRQNLTDTQKKLSIKYLESTIGSDEYKWLETWIKINCKLNKSDLATINDKLTKLESIKQFVSNCIGTKDS